MCRAFSHSLKVEAAQYGPIMDRETMRQAVFEYIEVDYNRARRHSALGYIAPENCELKMQFNRMSSFTGANQL